MASCGRGAAVTAPGPKLTARGFLSYAHEDWRLVSRFRRLLGPRLGIARDLRVSVWWDADILLGQRWDDEIRRAIREADFGLLLLSPALLSRDYIRSVEIPALLAATGALMPVGLQRVDFLRSDLQGLDPHQVFLYRNGNDGQPRWFADLGGENPARFCDALAGQVVDQLIASRP